MGVLFLMVEGIDLKSQTKIKIKII